MCEGHDSAGAQKSTKKWKFYSSDYRKRQITRRNADEYIDQNTPPSSDGENIPDVPVKNNERRAEAKRRSIVHRKKRNRILKNMGLVIDDLKKKLARQQQRNRRLKRRMIKVKKALTPKSKIEEMAKDPNQKAELVKKALFGEIIQTQILEKKIETPQKQTCLKTILSSPMAHKYKIWKERGHIQKNGI